MPFVQVKTIRLAVRISAQALLFSLEIGMVLFSVVADVYLLFQ